VVRLQLQRLPLVGALLALLSAVLLVTTAAPAAAETQPGWWNYDRPAAFESVTEQVHVPMRDGARLACFLYRPGRSGAVAPGRFPTIVHDYTPYYGRNGSTDGRTGSADSRSEYLAMRGYNVIRCAVRGTGQSDGDFPTWFREIELQDNYELIEWLAAQPWSTGRIGQSGYSYGGITSYRIAARKPPHLVAIAPMEAASNIYDEMIYPGGMFSEYYAGVWSALVSEGTSLPSDGLNVFNSFRSHPLFDEYWKQIAYQDKYGKIKVPVLGFGGWQDIFQWGMIRSYEGMASNGDPQRKGPWLIVGPWQHNFADQQPVQPVPAGVLLAWWDHWLQQRPDAPLPSAVVTSFEQPLVGGHGWEELAAWPPPDSVKQRFHFRVDSGLATAPGLEGARSYDVKPDGPSRHTLAGPRTDDPAADQASSDRRRMTYTTPPLVNDVVVAGAPEVRLKAKLSEADGAFIVKLEDVYPDGRVIEATTGHLKASHRLGHERGVAITPNELTEYVIPIKPTHWRFAKGHSIRVAVTSSDLPITKQQTAGGTVTLLSGPGGSFIDLPIRTKSRSSTTATKVVQPPSSGGGSDGNPSYNPPSSGGNLAATGLNTLLPSLSGLSLMAGLYMARRRRTTC
jgi:predicted acyl esterase